MGLDMYLYRRTYVKNWDHMKPEHRWTISIEPPVERNYINYKIDASRIAYVEEEVAYWRKANQIHAWFVDNVQGGVDECQVGPSFGPSKLQELVDKCKEVLIARNDPDAEKLAQERLAPQEGFFFGSTDIDEWYYEDLANTVQMLESALEGAEGGETEFLYHSSW